MHQPAPDQAKPLPEAGLFAATHWSLVLRAKDKSDTALGTLLGSYRQPLLIWLRARGSSPENAEDQVHGFIAHLLSRDFLQSVGQAKGRFRTFLLRCLKNYLSDQRDKAQTAKRGGSAVVVSLEETDEGGDRLYEPVSGGGAPDLDYDRAWAQAVLKNALAKLEQESARQGHAPLYREIEPVMFAEETASSYREIGARLGMSEAAVKVAAHRLRSRLEGLLRQEIRQTVANETDWKEEVKYLISLFGPRP